MDPNETLRRFRQAIADYRSAAFKFDRAEDGSPGEGQILNDLRKAAEDMADHGRALDEWLSRGGFKPNDWN